MAEENCGMPPPQFNESITEKQQYQLENEKSAANWSGQTRPTATDGHVQPCASVRVIIARPPSLKTLPEAYLLWFPLGLLGLHHFYLRRYSFGILYLFTGGVVGIGWIIDAFRLPLLVRDANRRIQQGPSSQNDENDTDDKVSLLDAYLFWFPLGIFGLHHYYLGRTVDGVVYTFTFGLFGIGWLIDAFRMPCLVSEANMKSTQEERTQTVVQKTVGNAYILGATPAGLFGAHHFYLGRLIFGIYYMLTLGGFGIGWIVDWFRMPFLVERANNPDKELLGTRHKYVDDAYVMAFPAGFLGLHHFYLERPHWGVLYLLTGGLLGVGWIVDLCRMPCLVAEANKKLADDAAMMYEAREQMGGACVTGKSGIVVIPANKQSAVGPQYPQQHSSVVINPAMLGSNESVASPPPYVETTTAMSDGHVMGSNLGLPPAYARYGSMDGMEKK